MIISKVRSRTPQIHNLKSDLVSATLSILGVNMKLFADEYNGIYVWVEELDENVELSPHFDYEADAIQWRVTMKAKLL